MHPAAGGGRKGEESDQQRKRMKLGSLRVNEVVCWLAWELLPTVWATRQLAEREMVVRAVDEVWGSSHVERTW